MKFKILKESFSDYRCEYQDLTEEEQKEVNEEIFEEIPDNALIEEIKKIFNRSFDEEDKQEFRSYFNYIEDIDEIPEEEFIAALRDEDFKEYIIPIIDECSFMFYDRQNELADELFGDKYEEDDDDLIDASIPNEYVYGAKDFYDPYSYRG